MGNQGTSSMKPFVAPHQITGPQGWLPSSVRKRAWGLECSAVWERVSWEGP